MTPQMPPSRATLVTGCSSGIGRATAVALHRAGLPVYASARRLESLRDLADAGLTTMALDVTDESSMQAAVDRVVADHGALGVLVNNAGYALQGPVETTPLAEVRAQFETNVFGLVRLTQLALPAMRAQRWGRVVNLSSMGGRSNCQTEAHPYPKLGLWTEDPRRRSNCETLGRFARRCQDCLPRTLPRIALMHRSFTLPHRGLDLKHGFGRSQRKIFRPPRGVPHQFPQR